MISNILYTNAGVLTSLPFSLEIFNNGIYTVKMWCQPVDDYAKIQVNVHSKTYYHIFNAGQSNEPFIVHSILDTYPNAGGIVTIDMLLVSPSYSNIDMTRSIYYYEIYGPAQAGVKIY